MINNEHHCFGKRVSSWHIPAHYPSRLDHRIVIVRSLSDGYFRLYAQIANYDPECFVCALVGRHMQVNVLTIS